MGLDDIVNKAKDALGGASVSDEAIDSAADAVKGVAPDQADGAIDTAADKAKEIL